MFFNTIWSYVKSSQGGSNNNHNKMTCFAMLGNFVGPPHLAARPPAPAPAAPFTGSTTHQTTPVSAARRLSAAPARPVYQNAAPGPRSARPTTRFDPTVRRAYIRGREARDAALSVWPCWRQRKKMIFRPSWGQCRNTHIVHRSSKKVF